jgi:hypothetical protein
VAIGRSISNLLLVKSFIFGTIILCVWVRSYFVSDTLKVTVGQKSTSLAAADGLIVYRAAADGENEIRLEQMTRRYSREEPARVIAKLPGGGEDVRFGFSYSKQAMWESGRGLVVTVTIPCWLFFILGSSKAIIWLSRRGVHKATAPALKYAWCARCQCEQPAEAAQCKRCGAAVAA